MAAINLLTKSRNALTEYSFRAIVAILLVSGLCPSALARLGETPEEIEARYGRPTMESKDLAQDCPLPVKCFWYHRQKSDSNKYATGILVTFWKGRCVREELIFNDEAGNKLEVRSILEHANAVVEANSSGQRWNFIPVGLGELGFMECGWERADGQAAAVVKKENKTILEIVDLKWSAEVARARQGAGAGAGGF